MGFRVTCKILEMSQGRAPLWASSTIFCLVESGNGLPFTKTPPSWLTPLWPVAHGDITNWLVFPPRKHSLNGWCPIVQNKAPLLGASLWSALLTTRVRLARKRLSFYIFNVRVIQYNMSVLINNKNFLQKHCTSTTWASKGNFFEWILKFFHH